MTSVVVSPPDEETMSDDDGTSRDSGLDDLGNRLRLLRLARGLSQRELAARAGVSNAVISLIEQNKTNPSVGLLKKVLDGLPLSIAEFFSTPVETAEKVFFAADELQEIAGGRISYLLVGSGVAGRQMQILLERYAPGADTGESLFCHEGQEGGVILRGRLEITVGSQRRVLGPGEAYYFDSRLPHRFRTVGDEEVESVSVCCPPSF